MAKVKSLKVMLCDRPCSSLFCFIVSYILNSIHESASLLFLQVINLKYKEIRKCDQVIAMVRNTRYIIFYLFD